MERPDTPPSGEDEEGVLEFVIFLDDDHNDVSSATKIAAEVHNFVEEASAGYIWHVQPFGLHVVRPDEPRGLQQRLRRPCLAGSMAFGDNVEDEWLATWLLAEVSRRFAAAGAVVQVSDNDGDFLLIEVAEHLPRWVHPEQMEHRVFIHGGELKLVPFGGADRRDAPGAPPAASRRAGVGTVDSSRGIPGRIPTAEAGAAWVREHAAAARVPVSMRDALSARLRGYPQRALRNMHCAAVCLPPRAAAVLSAAPQLIAPAVEAFYSRDSAEVSRAARMQHVLGPAEGAAAAGPIPVATAGPAAAPAGSPAAAPAGSPAATSPADAGGAAATRPVATAPGLVRMSVPMTRHLFAQLVQQRFHPPKAYAPLMPPRPRLPVPAQPAERAEAVVGAAGSAGSAGSAAEAAAAVQEYARYDLGCKIATGLEILLARGAGVKKFQEIMATAAPAAPPAQPAGAAAACASSSVGGASTAAPALGPAAAAPPLRDSAGFKAYLAALTRRGYFEGARSRAEHEAKAEAALGFYAKTQQQQPQSEQAHAGAAAVDARAAAADARAGGAAATTASASPASTATPSDALSRLSALLQAGVGRRAASDAGPPDSPSARLGRLLAHVALALPQLQAAGVPRVAPDAGGAVSSTGGTVALGAGSALPFAWPPRCDRDDDASWLFRADDTAMLDREMDRYLTPGNARAGASGDVLPLAGGSPAAGPLPPQAAAGSAAAGATAIAHATQASKQPMADALAAGSDSNSGSGIGESGDMSELRGLLSALSSFVKSTSSFEGADTGARRQPAAGADTATGASRKLLGGSAGSGNVDDEDGEDADSVDEADDDAASEGGTTEDGRDSEDEGDYDADKKDSAALRANTSVASAGAAAQATPAFEPGFDAERFMREVRAHLALREAASAASTAPAGLQQGGGVPAAAGGLPSDRTVRFAESPERQSQEHGSTAVAVASAVGASGGSDAAVDDGDDMLSVAAWEPEDGAADDGGDASEGGGAAAASRAGAGGSPVMGADEEGGIDDASLRSLMASMEAELYGGAGSTLGASFLRVGGPVGAAGRIAGAGRILGAGAAADGDGERDSSGAPLSDADLQYNLLASLSQSVAGQGGRAGPASNMLGDLGLSVPAAWWEAEARRAAGEDAGSDSDSDNECGVGSASQGGVQRATMAGAGEAAASHTRAHAQMSGAATDASGVASLSKAPSAHSVSARASDLRAAPEASAVPPSGPQLTAEERARVLASLAEWD